MTHRRFFLITATLFGFAVASPLFDILRSTPEFLVIRRASHTEVIALALVLTVLYPLIATMLRALSPSFVRKGIEAILLFLPAALFWLLHTHHVFIAIVAAALTSLVILYASKVQDLLQFLSGALPIFLVFFLQAALRFSLLPSGSSDIYSPQILDNAKLRPTILLIMDEFPLYTLLNSNNEINRQRYPNFGRLADRSVWFRNGSAVSSWTERAVPTILAGLHPDPQKKQVPNAAEYPNNIFTFFAPTHRVSSYEQVTNLCPAKICPPLTKPLPFVQRFTTLLEDCTVVYLHRLLPKEHAQRLPSIEGKWSHFVHHEISDAEKKKKHSHKGLVIKDDFGDDVVLFETFLSSISHDWQQLAERGQPPLSVIHITFPHVPYRYLPDGRKYALDRDTSNDREYTARWPVDGEGLAAVGLQRFMMQAAQMDSMLGKLLDRLEELGLQDSVNLAVVADHGSSFQPGEFSRRISDTNIADVVSVPFFISFAERYRSGEVNDENVSSVDVLPTLLEANGLSVPASITGISAYKKDQPRAAEKIFFPLNGKTETKTLPSLLDRSVSLQRLENLFGSGGFDDRFYALNVSGIDVLGKTASALQSVIDPAYKVRIHKAEKYLNLKSSTLYWPILMNGYAKKIDGSELPKKRLWIAFLVNGTVRTVLQTDLSKTAPKSAEFLGIIPPTSIVVGKNELSAFVLRDSALR
jgi:hypothetical protein